MTLHCHRQSPFHWDRLSKYGHRTRTRTQRPASLKKLPRPLTTELGPRQTPLMKNSSANCCWTDRLVSARKPQKIQWNRISFPWKIFTRGMCQSELATRMAEKPRG